jgi:hypothetical protein
MRLRQSALLLCAIATFASASAASAETWTAPVSLSTCGAVGAPKVVFPTSTPVLASGIGAIVWIGVSPSCTDVGAGVASIDEAALSSTDQPSAPRVFSGGAAAEAGLESPLVTASSAKGEIIAIAGSSTSLALGSPAGLLAEAPASAGFNTLSHLGGPADLVAAADGYIGDADVANVIRTASGSHSIELRAQRHWQHFFGPPLVLAAGRGPITALALGMDFRADTLVVWAQSGHVWARRVTNDGIVYPAQLLGPSGSDPQISAALSDDNRAFVVWTVEPPPSVSAPSTVFLAHSGANVIFHGTTQLSTFSEPVGVRLTPGAVALERLSGEGLAIVYPTMADGFYAVDVASVTQQGVVPPSLLSLPSQDVRAAAVATGPKNEIDVLVEVAPRTATGFDATQQQILATRSGETAAPAGGLGLGPLIAITPVGANSDPSVAIDPTSDLSVAAWQTTLTATTALQWSLGTPSPT